MTITIGYARIASTESAQAEVQHQRLLAAGAKEVMVDTISGQPQLQRLLEMAQNQEVQEIIITRIDQVSRKVSGLAQLLDTCVKSDVNLRILDQCLDLSTPTGKLMGNLLLAVAEWEEAGQQFD